VDFRTKEFDKLLVKIEYVDIFVAVELLEHLEDDLALLSKLPKNRHFVGSVPTFKSEAHLRTFDSAQEVIERYGSVISEIQVHRIIHWWVFGGTIV
jgi:hypothetical protein